MQTIGSSAVFGINPNNNNHQIAITGSFFGWYATVGRYVILLDMENSSLTFPRGIIITSWYVKCLSSASPATQLTGQLRYSNAITTGAFPSTNTLIDVITTTSGNSSETNMKNSNLGSGNIPQGKILYIDLTADPTDVYASWSIVINYKM